MAEFKPSYIITEMKKNVVLAWGLPNQPLEDYVPGKNRAMEHVFYIDGEVELWVEGKQYKFNKSFCAIVPEGVEHGPLTVRNVKNPIFHYTAGPAKLYM